MSLLSPLFASKKPSFVEPNGQTKTSGKLIAEMTNGASLVHSKQTWELADKKKNDISTMKQCCDAAMRKMKETGLIAAPFYFERVAILLRKEQKYAEEIHVCENYIAAVATFYRDPEARQMADVRKGPRFGVLENSRMFFEHPA